MKDRGSGMRRRTGTSELAREMNRTLLVEQLIHHQPVSRVELSRLTSLSPATVTVIVDELIRAGVVREVGVGTSTGGRKPRLLEFAPEAGTVTGVEVTANKVIGLVSDMSQRTKIRLESPLPSGRSEGALEALYRMLQHLLDTPQMGPSKVLGIGVAVPGMVDEERGRVIRARDLGWEDLPLAELIHERFSLPAQVERDVKAAAWGERALGAARGLESVVYVKVVPGGLGAGMILNGRLYRGAHRQAGEIGHIVVERNGPRCSCGNRGCVGIYLSGTALRQAALDALGSTFSPLSTEALAAQLRQAEATGDRRARRVIDEYGELFGIVVGHIANTFDPQAVVVGGPVVGLGERFFSRSREVFERSLLVPEDRLELLPAALGEDAGVIGVTRLVLESETEYIPVARRWSRMANATERGDAGEPS